MKRGGGKAKGSQFERDVCKKLSLWVSDGEREDLFWRSAMSGGRATVRNRRVRVRRGQKTPTVVRQGGDITSVALEGHVLTDMFYVECKHYKLLALDRFLLTNTGNLAKFWRETCKQAHRYDKMPMLIARQNGMPTIVVTEDGFVAGTSVAQTPKVCIAFFDAMMKVPFSESLHSVL